MKKNVSRLFLFFSLCFLITFFYSGIQAVQAQQKGSLVPVLEWPAIEPADDPLRWQASVLIGETWKKLGIRTRLTPKSFSALWGPLRDKKLEFDLFTAGYTGKPERFDPHVLLWMVFHSSQDVPGGANFMGYRSKEYDDAIENQRKEVDPEKRKKLIFQAQEILARDIPWIQLYFKNSLYAYNNTRFKGYQAQIGTGFFDVLNWTKIEPLTGDKTLKIAIERDWTYVSPYVTLLTTALPLLYDTLGVLSPDGTVKPWAAKGWKSIDPVTIDIELREGMKWHDGKPVTAEDVKFTVDYNKKWKVPKWSTGLDPIEKVDVIDKSRVRFKLKEPFPPLYVAFFAHISIMPKHIWEGLVEKESLKHPEDYPNPKPVGSGPFKFVHWRKGEESLFVRNDEHFSKPKVEKVLLIPYTTLDSAFAAIKKGEADYFERSLLPIQYDEAKKLKQLTAVEKEDIALYVVGFNLTKTPFNDHEFRRAIAHAIPYRQILVSVLGGKGIMGQAGGIITPALKYWFDPKVTKYDFNLEKSREILKKAGYSWDDQGLLHYPAGR